MRKNIILTLSLIYAGLSIAQIEAPARIGQYGFTQLMVNGWAQSSGMGNSNSAGVSGVESFFWNIAGLGKVNGTELAFSRSAWLGGTGININSFGFAQALKNGKGVVGMSVTSFSLGQIEITTTEQPEGGIGTYKPTISNINLGYAYNFGDKISAGLNIKLASESTPDIRTSAVGIDAGLQYADLISKNSAKYKNEDNNPAAARGSDIRFGVSLKNLGTDVRYTGDGLAAKSNVTDKYVTTTQQRSDKTSLPSFINIGFAYDFRLDKGESYLHRLTAASSFTSNVASSNQTSVGLEYSFKEILMLRTGYNYEKGVFKYETRNNAYTGVNFGATFQVPFGENKSNRIGIDYSYRATRPFSGTHTFGLRVNID